LAIDHHMAVGDLERGLRMASRALRRFKMKVM
jgi:hypothetical protein